MELNLCAAYCLLAETQCIEVESDKMAIFNVLLLINLEMPNSINHHSNII